MSDEERFKKILNKMYETFKAKNADYGDSAHKTFEEYGLVSFLVRMSDKMNRMATLVKKEAKVKDEKIEDTLGDLANYCVLALLELEKEKESKVNPNASEK